MIVNDINKRGMLVNNEFVFATECEFRSKVWFDIGKLIYKLSEGSNKGYRLWLMYSKMDRENFNDYYCHEYWDYLVTHAYSESENRVFH